MLFYAINDKMRIRVHYGSPIELNYRLLTNSLNIQKHEKWWIFNFECFIERLWNANFFYFIRIASRGWQWVNNESLGFFLNFVPIWHMRIS